MIQQLQTLTMIVIKINQYYEYIYKQRLYAREHKDRSCDALFEKIIEIVFKTMRLEPKKQKEKRKDFWFLWFNVSRLFLLKNNDSL